MPALLPDDWKGGVTLLFLVFVRRASSTSTIARPERRCHVNSRSRRLPVVGPQRGHSSGILLSSKCRDKRANPISNGTD